MQAQEAWKTLAEIQQDIDAGTVHVVIRFGSKCPRCSKRMSAGDKGLAYRKDITDTTRKELTAHCKWICLFESYVATYLPNTEIEVV